MAKSSPTRSFALATDRLGYRASLRIVSDGKFFRLAANPRNRLQVISGGWAADYPAAAVPGGGRSASSCA